MIELSISLTDQDNKYFSGLMFAAVNVTKLNQMGSDNSYELENK